MTAADDYRTFILSKSQWAEQHARAGSWEWAEVARLFAAYDLRGRRLVALAERVAGQPEALSQRAER